MEKGANTAAKKVLIVDDDDIMRDLIAFALAQEGYATTGAHNVAAAMEVIERSAPDLLVTDIRLGEHNGLQLLAMARVPIPAIVLTGFADPVIEAEARRLGAEYLLKPVSPSALCAIVARKLAAAEQGTFFCSRQSPRQTLAPPIPLHVGDTNGKLCDVSDTGARLQVERSVGSGLPLTLSLSMTFLRATVPVEVVWKRRLSETVWECGVVASPDARQEWQSFLAAVRSPGGASI